jgi:hypothetical protein
MSPTPFLVRMLGVGVLVKPIWYYAKGVIRVSRALEAVGRSGPKVILPSNSGHSIKSRSMPRTHRG